MSLRIASATLVLATAFIGCQSLFGDFEVDEDLTA